MSGEKTHKKELLIRRPRCNFKGGWGEQASRDLSCDEIAWRAVAVVIVGAVAAMFPGPG